MRISLVCTAKNEEDNIAQLIESMLGQSLRPDEIIINDNNSTDATAAIVQGYHAAGHPVRLVQGGFNIPSGRNNAIYHATGTLIACTDAGLILDRHWLARITEPLRDGSADVVAGFFQPLPRSIMEHAIGCTNYPVVEEIDAATFMPFGQSVAFRKTVWEQVDGYPEWASHCEDLLYDFAMKKAGARFAFAGSALVHFRPRESLQQIFKQYFFYARGDAVAGLWPKRHAMRYLVYAIGLLLLLFGGWGWVLLVAGGIGYSLKPWQRIEQRRSAGYTLLQSVLAAVLVPCIRVVGDCAKMMGYLAGYVRLWRLPMLRQDRDAWRSRFL
jgi:glycosyltransferase involved in cell wall biosynthesis